MHQTSITFALINFGVAAILCLQAEFDKQRQSTFEKFAATLFGAATFATVLAAALLHLEDFLPTAISKQKVWFIALIAIAAMIAYMWLRIKTVLMYMSPLATVLTFLYLVDLVQVSKASGIQSGQEIYVIFHVIGALMGQVLALCSSLIALMYLWQQRALKQKRLSDLLTKAPPLELLHKILLVCLWSGFIFLSLALISGMSYLNFDPSVSPPEQLLKIGWAFSIWGWYLAILILKFFLRKPARQIAMLSLGGFLLLSFTSFGLNYVLHRGGL